MPAAKELHYFNTDLKVFSPYCNTLDEYLEWFSGVDKDLVGEISVWYLYSKTAAKAIYQFNPKAKIIILLRNPIDMMSSLHSEFVFRGSEDVSDFKKALALEKDREKGKHVPRNCRVPQTLCYRKVVGYSQQIARYLKLFGREQVKIVLFEDLTGCSETSLKDIFRFLGVKEDVEIKYIPANSNKIVRSRRLQNTFLYPGRIWLLVFDFIVPRKLRPFFVNSVLTANSRRVERKSLSKRSKEKLLAELAPEINRAEKLLGVDLGVWRKI